MTMGSAGEFANVLPNLPASKWPTSKVALNIHCAWQGRLLSSHASVPRLQGFKIKKSKSEC